MKSNIQIKWLYSVDLRNDREFGFVRVTLLMALVIAGIFGLIHLARFISQRNESRKILASCHREDRCINDIMKMNRAQQDFYLKKQNVSVDPRDLRLGFPLQTENYQYEIAGIPSDQPTTIANLATPIVDDKKAYLGLVLTMVKNGDRVTMGKICEYENPTGKNPTWESLPTESDREHFDCDNITVGGQNMVDSGLLSFSRVGEEESEE